MPGIAARPRSLRENRTRYVVLGMLTAGPVTGYGLRQRIAGSVGHFWQESYGQLYPTLRQLAAEKLVVARASHGAPGRGATTYHLTPRGREALASWVALPAATERVRNEVLLKLFFAGAVPPAVMMRNLDGVAAEVRAQRAELERIAAWMDGEGPVHPDSPFWRLTLDFGLDYTRTMLEWLGHAQAVLRARARGTVAPAARPAAPRRTRRSR